MHIGVNQLAGFAAMWALSASIIVDFVGAKNVLRECHGQREFSAAFGTEEEEGVGDSLFIGHEAEGRFDVGLGYDGFEIDGIVVSWFSSVVVVARH